MQYQWALLCVSACMCSTLALTRISSDDEAIYQCIAENSAGTNQASARLAVAQAQDLPAAPQGLRASALSNNALQLTWSQPPANITDSIIGYVLHIRKIGGESLSAKLQNMQHVHELILNSITLDIVISFYMLISEHYSSFHREHRDAN